MAIHLASIVYSCPRWETAGGGQGSVHAMLEGFLSCKAIFNFIIYSSVLT